MATVLDDLLRLSQVTQADMNLEDVDLSAEVTVICDQFRARDPGRQVRVTVQEGIRVTADRALIRSALDNLLDNAWKFTSRREGAAIEFATAPTAGASLCCYVRDNGPASTPPTSATCSSRSGSTTPRTSPAPGSASPPSGASSTATAAGPGPKAPSTAAPPSTSPSTLRASVNDQLLGGPTQNANNAGSSDGRP